MKSPRNSHINRSLRGFTLVELLVVVAIIVVLSGLVVGVSGFVQRKAAVKRAQAQLKKMELGLEEYKRDNGGYPEFNPETVGKDEAGLILYRILFGDGIGEDGIAGTADDGELDGKPDDGAEVYIADFDPKANSEKMLDIRDKANPIPVKVMDPWGNAWRYRSGAGFDMENPDFDIWSLGPDGRANTGDDINNWQ